SRGDSPRRRNSNHTVDHVHPSESPDSPWALLLAPWRSPIYRNVDTPFTYSDDLALFPHMPMNVPGFDCRAPRILGDWMVSIPAVRKSPEIREDQIPVDQFDGPCSVAPDADGGAAEPPGTVHYCDGNPQPFVEVKPPDKNLAGAELEQAQKAYDDAKTAADHRLLSYHEGLPPALGTTSYSRYNFCPDTSDIVDPESIRDPV